MKEISRRDLLKTTALGTTAFVLASCDSSLPISSLFPLPSSRPDPTRAQEPTPIISEEPIPTMEPTIEPTPKPTPNPTPKPTTAPGVWIKYRGEQVVWHGDLDKKDVYLTMDDGWSTKNMETALKTANDKGIKMTFCPVGKLIPQNPGMYKEIISEGHDVQNHTYTHRRLDRLTKPQIKTEILKARDALWNAVGFEYPQHFVRPPGEFGVTGIKIYEPLFDATEELGYRVLVWDDSSGGTSYGAYSATPAQIAQVEKNVESKMHNGAITLQHAINVDVAAFPHIVDYVKSHGWRPITVRQGLG